MTPQHALIFLALATTIQSLIPRLGLPWQVPMILLLIALLVPVFAKP